MSGKIVKGEELRLLLLKKGKIIMRSETITADSIVPAAAYFRDQVRKLYKSPRDKMVKADEVKTK